jgi:hypothetical protein
MPFPSTVCLCIARDNKASRSINHLIQVLRLPRWLHAASNAGTYLFACLAGHSSSRPRLHIPHMHGPQTERLPIPCSSLPQTMTLALCNTADIIILVTCCTSITAESLNIGTQLALWLLPSSKVWYLRRQSNNTLHARRRYIIRDLSSI